MRSKNVLFATSALAYALFAPAISQSADEWVDIKDPTELSALYSNKTWKSIDPDPHGHFIVTHFSADGKGVMDHEGEKFPRTWKVRENDQVCVTSQGTVCYRVQRLNGDPNTIWIHDVNGNVHMRFKIEDGISKF
jgi:hypothetical protein